MKHLNNYKIFESDNYKDPIDVESDVVEFRAKFSGNRRVENVEHMLKKLVDDNPTMSDDWNIYAIHSVDDYGREIGGPIILVKGVNKGHARLKAAFLKNNIEIYSTGFYTAVQLNIEQHEARIRSLENELKKLRDIR